MLYFTCVFCYSKVWHCICSEHTLGRVCRRMGRGGSQVLPKECWQKREKEREREREREEKNRKKDNNDCEDMFDMRFVCLAFRSGAKFHGWGGDAAPGRLSRGQPWAILLLTTRHDAPQLRQSNNAGGQQHVPNRWARSHPFQTSARCWNLPDLQDKVLDPDSFLFHLFLASKSMAVL